MQLFRDQIYQPLHAQSGEMASVIQKALYDRVSPSSEGEDESIIREIHVEITDFWCLNITCGLYAEQIECFKSKG